MSRRHHKMVNGDKVNHQGRFKEGKQGNGFVRRIIYGDDGPEEVIVQFDDGTEIYPYEDFRHAWTDDYGGVYMLT